MAKEIVVTLANGDKAGETLKALTHQAAALRKEISNLKPGTEDFVKASNSLNQVKDRMSDIDKQVKSTTSSSDALKKAWNALPDAGFFNQIGESFGLAKQGIGGLTSGFGLLQKAIISTGFGVLVVALGLVFNWMSKLESVTNVISGLFDGLAATVEVLGKAIATLDFSNLGDNMAKAATEAYNLVQAYDELEDKQRGISILNAASEKDIDQLLLKSKNVELSFAQRLELLNQAAKKERDNYNARLRYAAEYLLTVNREVELAKLKGEVDDVLADKQAAAIRDFIAVQRESVQLQEKIENRSAALREKMVAEEAKRKEKEQKRKDEEAKQLQQQDDAVFGGMQLALEKELAALESHEKAKELLDKKTKAEQAARDKKAYEDAKKLREQEEEEQLAKQQFEQRLAAFNLETQRLVFGGIGELIAQNIKDEQAARAIKKTMGVIDIGIRLGQELSANALAAAANPLNAITFGAAGAAQLAASNTRSIIMAAINTARVLSFDRGGYTGDGGKYDPAGVVHKGEVVWSQADVAAFGGVRAVEAIRPTSNLMRGYYMGGPVSPFGNNTGRGPIPSGNASSSAAAMGFDYDQMAAAFDRRVDNKIKWIRVQNVVTETQDAMKVVNRIKAEADV